MQIEFSLHMNAYQQEVVKSLCVYILSYLFAKRKNVLILKLYSNFTGKMIKFRLAQQRLATFSLLRRSSKENDENSASDGENLTDQSRYLEIFVTIITEAGSLRWNLRSPYPNRGLQEKNNFLIQSE